MRFEVQDDGKVTDQAAQWLAALLHENERPQEVFAWLAKSPQHVQELAFMLADVRDIALLQPEDLARVEKLARTLGTDDANAPAVVPLSQRALASLDEKPVSPPPAQRRNPNLRPRMRWMAGMAAAVLLTCTALWFTGPGRWKTYSTQVGEQRVLELADGSLVHLNTDSQITVRLNATSRSVRLARGQALFSVEQDTQRPFQVHAGSTVIRALGTRFDVYRRNDATRVAVLEGRVQISEEHAQGQASPVLAAGEAADVSAQGRVSLRGTVDSSKATAWYQRRLIFENDTLGDIAAEFNRYNAHFKIRVLDEAAANDRFSGTFDADEPQAVVRVLEMDPTLSIERSGAEILIRERRRAGH